MHRNNTTHRLATLTLLVVLIIILIQSLPWWIRKNIANLTLVKQIDSFSSAHQDLDTQSAKILNNLQPSREIAYAADAAASLLRYLVVTGNEEQAGDLVQQASKSNSPNPLMWYDLARLAESNKQWSIASRAWKKAGFQPNVERSMANGQILVLDDFDDFSRWMLHPGENTRPVIFQADGDEVTIRYQDQPATREQISYYLSLHQFNCPEGTSLSLEAWNGYGGYLTLDVVVNGEAERLLAYEPGEDRWQQYLFPIAAGNLERILIGLGEPDGVSGNGAERILILHKLELILRPSPENSVP